MKINTKIRYGVRTLIDIAMHGNEKGIYQKEISDRQEISFKYLDHIISSLKASGLIMNAEGRGSGYMLARKPEKITVYDVYKAFENELKIIDCVTLNGECKRDSLCATKDFWYDFNMHMADFMNSTSIGALARKQREIEKGEELNMYYI